MEWKKGWYKLVRQEKRGEEECIDHIYIYMIRDTIIIQEEEAPHFD